MLNISPLKSAIFCNKVLKGSYTGLTHSPFKPEFAIVIFIPTCRNSQLVVDEDDLKWLTNEKNVLLFLKRFLKNVRSKTTRCGKLGHSLEMQNDALVHREGLKGAP